MVAIYLPLDIGIEWLTDPPAFFSLLVPLVLVGTMIPDSFAGERERHTLTTLLASRLPDGAILWGKMALAVAYGFGMTVVVLLVGLVTVNVAHWQGHISLYTPRIGLSLLGLTLLLSMVVTGAGVLISLRSSTVQEAQQLLMAIMLTLPLVLGMVFFVLHDRIGRALESMNLTFVEIVLILAAVLAVLAAALNMAARARFKRARLILD